MSLSKYYKSSNSFKPEEIVKQEGSKTSGWTPAPRKNDISSPNQAFAAAKDLPATSRIKETVPPPAARNSDSSKPLKPTEKAAIDDIATTPLADDQHPPEKQIDLSNYIEISIAEGQREDAYRQGLEEGRRDGHAKADQDFGKATKALLLACQQLDTLRETIIKNSSQDIIDFCLAIAERILRISVQEQDSTIIETIEEALRRAVKSDEFSVFIHPDDYDTVMEKADEIVAGISGLNNIVVRRDKTTERGGAKIESDNCTIDATIASQFEIIREEVKKKL